MNADNNSRAVSKYVWMALVTAVMLITGSIWLAVSMDSSVRTTDDAAKPDFPAGLQAPTPAPEYSTNPSVRTDPMPAPAVPTTAVVKVTQVKSQQGLPPKPSASYIEQPPAESSRSTGPSADKQDPDPHDMFPVGNIVKDTPHVEHQTSIPQPEQQAKETPEAYPSFEYEGKTWSATGSFVTSEQADLASTGHQLQDGQKLFALNSATSSDDVLFIQSTQDPDKFAVYRAT